MEGTCIVATGIFFSLKSFKTNPIAGIRMALFASKTHHKIHRLIIAMRAAIISQELYVKLRIYNLDYIA